MAHSLSSSIRDRIAALLADQISLFEFQDWLVGTRLRHNQARRAREALRVAGAPSNPDTIAANPNRLLAEQRSAWQWRFAEDQNVGRCHRLLISHEVRPMLRRQALGDAEERGCQVALGIKALPLLDRKRGKHQIMDDD